MEAVHFLVFTSAGMCEFHGERLHSGVSAFRIVATPPCPLLSSPPHQIVKTEVCRSAFPSLAFDICLPDAGVDEQG